MIADWPLANPARIRLPRSGEIHLWAIDLNQPPPVVTLNAAETCRAQRYHRECDRRRFRHARASLRWLLGGYLSRDPSGLTLEADRYGRPALIDVSFDFNLSHSEDLALLAVSPHRLGIDLEYRHDRHLDAMTEACHPLEQSFIQQQPDPTLAFLRCWTRKEACLKADGRGLSLSPSALITLDTISNDWLGLVRVEDRTWHLHELELGSTWVSALACECRTTIHRYRLDHSQSRDAGSGSTLIC